MRRRRGSTMVEGAIVVTTFMILMIGVMDFGRFGFTYSSIAYATHRAARYAATRGSSSGHPVAGTDVTTYVQNTVVNMDNSRLNVNTYWPTNNNPGSQVQVVVTYTFKPMLLPISSGVLNIKCTSTQYITQ